MTPHPILHALLNLIPLGVETSITVTLPGATVSGILVSRRVYLDAMADHVVGHGAGAKLVSDAIRKAADDLVMQDEPLDETGETLFFIEAHTWRGDGTSMGPQPVTVAASQVSAFMLSGYLP